MPVAPTSAQSEASRQNGQRSTGPATEAGKARAALNSVRHGLSGQSFFLLPDEDPAEFRAHEALWLAEWRPRDLPEQEAAAAAIRAMWREIRADRLEALVLTDLFAAGRIEDEAERQAAKAAAMKALAILLRYRGRIEREQRAAMTALDRLRQRRLRGAPGTLPKRTRATGRSSQNSSVAAGRGAERTRARPAPEPPPAPRAGGHGPPRRLSRPASVRDGRSAAASALAWC